MNVKQLSVINYNDKNYLPCCKNVNFKFDIISVAENSFEKRKSAKHSIDFHS